MLRERFGFTGESEMTERDKKDRKDDANALIPFVRSILAFALKLRLPNTTTQTCYQGADEFIAQLNKDLE